MAASTAAPTVRTGAAVTHPFLAADPPGTVRAIAHRGGRGDAPENTVAAFAQAVARGYTLLETDVHATRDGELVVSHDATFARVGGDGRAIAEMTAAEVGTVRLCGEAVPTLAELLATFPTARFTVDLKSDAAVGPLRRLLELRPQELDRLVIGSFRSARVDAIRAVFGRRVCTMATPRELVGLVLAARTGRRPRRLLADCAAVPQRWPGSEHGDAGWLPVGERRLMALAAELALPVHVWTVNDPDRVRTLLGLGAAGFITDDLAMLRGVLEEAQVWAGRPHGRATSDGAAGDRPD
jgi:glycerophosphoryl diester phosphodiesterase